MWLVSDTYLPGFSLPAETSRIGKELGVDPEVILQTSHGRRSVDVLEVYDKSKANDECEKRKTTQQCLSLSHGKMSCLPAF
jgi:hypothetical protein